METKEIKDEDRPDPDSKWPCLFGMMGSAFAFMKVHTTLSIYLYVIIL